ncbi:cora-domain-containing protein [Apiospora aurea]|uniref:Cora-domain-containing protein n=1 Tax=Apiospora aurea TaxID=335848 RepID=A0ABR1PWS3_9PEZI
MATSGNPFSPLDRARPTLAGPSQTTPAESSNVSPGSQIPKKKKHRGGRKHRRPRRKSFAAPADEDGGPSSPHRGGDEPTSSRPNNFYMRGRNLSNTSIESEALLDHREHPWGSRPRRPSTIMAASFQLSRGGGGEQQTPRPRTAYKNDSQAGDDNNDEEQDELARMSESAPLLPGPTRTESSSRIYGSSDGMGSWGGRQHRDSMHRGSSKSSWRGQSGLLGPPTPGTERYNVNYPPSMPGSPRLGGLDRMDVNFGDELMLDQLASASKDDVNSLGDEDTGDHHMHGSPSFQRRHTIALEAQEDVCFPQEGMSEIADDELNQARDQRNNMRRSRRRREKWPDLAILEEWSRIEKEGRSDERRIKKITEPQLINGRLRPIHKGWFRAEEDAPYRFTYFNEEFQSTVHSQTISELVQPDASFRELFVPERPILSDSSSDEDDELEQMPTIMNSHFTSSLKNGETLSKVPSMAFSNRETRNESTDTTHLSEHVPSSMPSRHQSGEATPMGFPMGIKSPTKSTSPKPEKPIRYGDRPVWWLDVLSPTEAEMKVIQKTFGIHPLTSEDIMLQEQREKVELFRHYYFVNYRSFDQDSESATHLEPVNLYLVVFREGVISFHFQQTPHPANVRRRIRQLKDYMVLSADWISYAIIDDITDVFVPLIQKIEEEVDDIDDAILMAHRGGDPDGEDGRQRDGRKDKDASEKKSIAGDTMAGEVPSDGDMLQRVGSCRKKVMGLYRLLGNKADVIKGFAKRCNEHWEVAPRSEIGLYLGDIQDHIVTMTSNLSHYEVILARSHGNYLAQINIRMNERSEQTADTLGKLTVLGTIVLPMNIITGLWGMNVWVPGQEYEGNLTWFWCITGGLLMFGMGCFFIAKRVYKIV